MTTEPIGVYVHIPYCIRKCNYCDFCSLPEGGGGVPDVYVDRLCEEILAYRGECKIPASTLYFGGGTPSLLCSPQLEKIISALNLVFDFTSELEFTLEANPGTVNEEKLRQLRGLGVNRLSLGMQSAHVNELSALGRIHNHTDLTDAFLAARRVGFDNISCDLMYGIPHQTEQSFRDTLTALTELNPEHISVYGLMIEEGTPFYEMQGTLPLPSEELECEMYYLADKLLTSSGYSHYEISNYAKEGKESRHNLKYWYASEYLGFGAAAASFFCGKRFVNTSNVSEYLKSNGASYNTCEALTDTDIEFEYCMLRLRLKEGIVLADYKDKFGRDFYDGREGVIEKMSMLGLLEAGKERIALTAKGFYLSNTVMCELL